MGRFAQEIWGIFDSHKSRSDSLFELFRKQDDLLAVVLRGHLALEQLLFAAIAAHCPDPGYLQDAKLRFVQLMPLLRSLEKLPVVPEHTWDALNELNAMRNALAHNMKPAAISERIQKFVGHLSKGGFQPQFPGTPTELELLKAAISYLLGQLSVVAPFQAAMEELIRERLRETVTEPPNKIAGAQP